MVLNDLSLGTVPEVLKYIWRSSIVLKLFLSSFDFLLNNSYPRSWTVLKDVFRTGQGFVMNQIILLKGLVIVLENVSRIALEDMKNSSVHNS